MLATSTVLQFPPDDRKHPDVQTLAKNLTVQVHNADLQVDRGHLGWNPKLLVPNLSVPMIPEARTFFLTPVHII